MRTIIDDTSDSKIQIGGLGYYKCTDILLSQIDPRETIDTIDHLSQEIYHLRTDSVAQILEVFRRHPNREYEFFYPSLDEYDPMIAVDIWKEQVNQGNGYDVQIAKGQGNFQYEEVLKVFVDEDFIIKVELNNIDYTPIELGDIFNPEIILAFISNAKERIEDSRGGVFYIDLHKKCKITGA